MNLWHTSHSNIRVMRCICRWRSNMFFVLQTKLQKTHSNPGRTEAGCTGAWGRGTGGQEQGRDPLSSPLPPVFYTLPDAVPCISVLKEVNSFGVNVTLAILPPHIGCKSSQKECSGTQYLRPTPLLTRGHASRVGRAKQAKPPPPLPFSGFSSLFSEGWLPGTTEMTSRLFPLLFFWELSESSLLLAESLRAEREDDEGLFDSLGVFLSSTKKEKKTPSLLFRRWKPWDKQKSGGVGLCLMATPSFRGHKLRSPAPLVHLLGSQVAVTSGDDTHGTWDQEQALIHLMRVYGYLTIIKINDNSS